MTVDPTHTPLRAAITTAGVTHRIFASSTYGTHVTLHTACGRHGRPSIPANPERHCRNCQRTQSETDA